MFPLWHHFRKETHWNFGIPHSCADEGKADMESSPTSTWGWECWWGGRCVGGGRRACCASSHRSSPTLRNALQLSQTFAHVAHPMATNVKLLRLPDPTNGTCILTRTPQLVSDDAILQWLNTSASRVNSRLFPGIQKNEYLPTVAGFWQT